MELAAPLLFPGKGVELLFDRRKRYIYLGNHLALLDWTSAVYIPQMSSQKTLQNARAKIEATFNGNGTCAFKKRDLAELLGKHRGEWGMPVTIGFEKFLDFLLKQSKLRTLTLKSDQYDDLTRYVWKDASVQAVALSIKNKSYLTHGTALSIHALTNQKRTVYVNYEQSPKPRGGELSQTNLDRAFAGGQRKSHLTYSYADGEIVVVNGKFTDRLEVMRIRNAKGEDLDVTRIERTLIDIVVRPAYAGGVDKVLEAFQKARGRISVNTLATTLKTLDYVYPYHQAIGFYMERAGYDESDWSKFRKPDVEFDFYLAHQLPPDRKYDSKWRIYYPGNLDSLVLHQNHSILVTRDPAE